MALSAQPLSLARAQARQQLFEASDLFKLEAASDPQISPDGSQIAYVRRSADIMTDSIRSSIWMIDVRTGEQHPIVAGPGNHTQPRWSPDGRHLAYASTAEGGSAQLFVRWLAAGTTTRLAALPAPPSNIRWSHDGATIAFLMRVPARARPLGTVPARPEGAQWAPAAELYTDLRYRTDEDGHLKPGHTQVFVIPRIGGPPRQLTDHSSNSTGPLSWAPDGRTIYFTGNRSPEWQWDGLESELYGVDTRSGDVRAITDRKGPDAEPAVSPDGRYLAYTGFDDDGKGYHVARLYLIPTAGGVARVLTPRLDLSIANPIWAADGKSLYVLFDDRAERKVAQIALDGSIRELMTGLAGQELDRPYTGGTFTVSRNGRLAATTGGAQRPPDVSSLDGRSVRRLTLLNENLLGDKALAPVVKLTARSFDGRLIESWLTLPPGRKAGERVPLILEIHGGPRAAYGAYFSFDNQLYAAAGYAVLSANPRGSTSYGDEFANLIHHDYPGRDYDDLMAAVDSTVAQGFADPARLFVTGGSGGGLLAAWTIGKTSRFRAAAIQKPIISMASFSLTSDQPHFYSSYWFGAFPWEKPEAFWSRSPLSLVGQVETPTLVVVGTQDYRTPPSEAEQFYAALKLRRVPSALVKIPGANHVGLAARPSQAAARLSAIIEWFRMHDRQ